MSSPSTWAAHRPTSASSSTAQSSKCRRARSRARTSARPCCGCARWARAAARSPKSARTACSRSEPRSSGSVPGPACYDRGGTEATVTDANLLLGALSGETLLAGTLRLDEAAARAALERTGAPLGMDALQTAAGIIRIVNTHMAVDIRLALQEQGQDPRSFALIAFGGAGPLHAATLARSVGISTVLVPRYPGLNCALGMLQTSVRHSYLRSEIGSLARIAVGRVNELFATLEAHAMQEAKRGGLCARPGEADAAARSALSAPGLFAVRAVPGTVRRGRTPHGQARLRCAASERLRPERAERERRRS